MTGLTSSSVSEKVPPLDDMIYDDYSTEALMFEISTRGRKLSATECCKYFCTPPGKQSILVNALEGTDKGIGHYNHDAKGTIDFLRKTGIAKKPTNDKALIEVIASAPPGRIVIIDRKRIPSKPNFLKVEYTKNVSQED